MRILFAASEIHPLAGTGGLGEVTRALTAALAESGCDVRVALPAYRGALRSVTGLHDAGEIRLAGYQGPVRLLQAEVPGTQLPLYLVDAPALFDRPGGLYGSGDGRDWPDNAARFALFSRAAAAIATGRSGIDWRAQVVHCHDWQSGLVPALLGSEANRPATVFTIHNLAYSGSFNRSQLDGLGLPAPLFSVQGLEFYGNFSFLKGGLMFSDLITTVSPAYAREIQGPDMGCGMDGILRHRGADLVGILNGVDYTVWDPATDPGLQRVYDRHHLDDKQYNKDDLQRRMGLDADAGALVVGLVTRLVHQKGVDLVAQAFPGLRGQNLQLALQGEGAPELKQQMTELSREFAGRVACRFGYDDTFAHRIFAGADVLLMPSRYEPCGLAQLYAMRYGTIPVVRRTGGLSDSVVAAEAESLRLGTATGIVFEHADEESVADALRRAGHLYADKAGWRRVQETAMSMDFSWRSRIPAYLDVYRRAMRRAGVPATP